MSKFAASERNRARLSGKRIRSAGIPRERQFRTPADFHAAVSRGGSRCRAAVSGPDQDSRARSRSRRPLQMWEWLDQKARDDEPMPRVAAAHHKTP
jgi:hypothetical protein